MDIQLPCMSGFECVVRLKEACPDIQVMMVTVYDNHLSASIRNPNFAPAPKRWFNTWDAADSWATRISRRSL